MPSARTLLPWAVSSRSVTRNCQTGACLASHPTWAFGRTRRPRPGKDGRFSVLVTERHADVDSVHPEIGAFGRERCSGPADAAERRIHRHQRGVNGPADLVAGTHHVAAVEESVTAVEPQI